jgi:hypothetical protein
MIRIIWGEEQYLDSYKKAVKQLEMSNIKLLKPKRKRPSISHESLLQPGKRPVTGGKTCDPWSPPGRATSNYPTNSINVGA